MCRIVKINSFLECVLHLHLMSRIKATYLTKLGAFHPQMVVQPTKNRTFCAGHFNVKPSEKMYGS